VSIAGRDGEKAVQFAAVLGAAHRGLAINLNDRSKVDDAVRQHAVTVNCAGPFSKLDTCVLDACLKHKRPYVDIGDDRSYVKHLRSRNNEFVTAGVAALFGCSSLPAISGALAIRLMQDSPVPPHAATVTLLIGNNNPKGIAAITSLLESLGRPIAAPQGSLRCFRESVAVRFPEPFGRRRNYPAETPEYDLFPELLCVADVRAGFCFELRISNWLMAALSRLPIPFGRRTANFLSLASRPFQSLGTSGGAIMTELTFSDGSTSSAAMIAREHGQRMAALPCSLAAQSLAGGKIRPGVGTAYDLLGADELLRELTRRGFELHLDAVR
jgi:hypothetical protein